MATWPNLPADLAELTYASWLETPAQHETDVRPGGGS